LSRAATAAVISLALLFGGAYLGSPFYTAWQLRAAARSGDRERLEQLVDFPEVRAHLKSQLDSRLQQEVQQNPKLKHSALAALGALLAPALTDRIIDSVVTPDTVATVIQSGRASRPAEDTPGEAQAPTEPASAHPHVRVLTSFRDLDHFLMTITDRSDPAHVEAVVTLSRRGLFSWRATQIDVPALLDQAKAAAAPK
jgi:hypothetical protein